MNAKEIVWIIIAIVVIGGGWLLLRDTTPADTSPIKIGFIGPLTGDAASIGENARAAVEIAVEEVNAAGGINGRPLEVIYEDGQCNGAVASNAANKLINIDRVPVILGGACSGETSAFAGAAEQSRTVTLSYCSSAPAISQAGDYIFRDYPSDTFQGAFAAKYMTETLGTQNVAILYAKSDWGNGIKDVFRREFEEMGGNVVAEEGYEQTSRDLRSQLTKIKAANPEAVYFLGYTEASIPGLKQAKELGLNVPLFGGDAWDDSKIWTDTGPAGDEAMYSIVYAPLNEEFRIKMKDRVGTNEITICSPQAYDGVKVLSQVMEKVGTDSEAIKNELYNTIYAGGVSGDRIEFDENGDLVGANYIVKKAMNGVAEPVQ
ncbi:MAG: ABC transporter substrate-binding protein [Parcubacteria group bacterium]|nr:ABC transporter substrate-binding protein [Parcubacteria group bacterium]